MIVDTSWNKKNIYEIRKYSDDIGNRLDIRVCLEIGYSPRTFLSLSLSLLSVYIMGIYQIEITPKDGMGYTIFEKRLVTNGLKWQFQNVQESYPHFLDTDVAETQFW